MKNSNFILIPGWVINHLELNATESIVYSFIYGYTQNGKNWYQGSFKDIQDELKFIKKRTIITIMKKLLELDLIEKKNDGSVNNYRVKIDNNLPIFASANFAQPTDLTSAKFAQPPVQILHSDILNNIYNNNIIDFLKKNNIELTKSGKRFVEIILDEIWIDQHLKRMLANYKLFTDFDKEVLPILYKFIVNKIAGDDISGRQGFVRTQAFSYVKAVLENNKSNENNSTEKLPIL